MKKVALIGAGSAGKDLHLELIRRMGLEIIDPDNLPTMPFEEARALLRVAYGDGELTFTRANTYGKHIAPPGYIFYLICFNMQDKNVYDGAFKMSVNVESELLETPGRLQEFLIFKLVPEIT